MRLLVLTYRLTKIKGVLVSVGVCALTNATMFLASAAGTAGLALAFSSAAQAVPLTTPGCNALNGDGTIASSTGTPQLWTAPSTCTVTGTIATVNGDALTATGTLTHGSLTNNLGYLHASLSGTALNSAHVAGLTNVTNVGFIQNGGDSTITGDYIGGTTLGGVRPLVAGGLAGPGNTFQIYGADNQSTGSIGTFNNYGLIQGTIATGIAANTVAQGVLVGLNNDGTIGTLYNSALIQATLGGSVSRQSNTFAVIGLANSNQTGTLTNVGTIDGDDVAILNGNVALSGSSILFNNSATISQLSNTGSITAGGTGIANFGHIDTITNSGSGVIVGNGFAGIFSGPSASIGLIDNQAGAAIIGVGFFAAVVNAGTISTLTNEGYIGTEDTSPFAIVNGGTIGTLTNSGTITATVTGLVNKGGSIGSLTNSGFITGGSIGIANVTGTNFSTISANGTIDSLVNTGSIGGGVYGILNSGLISSLSNQSYQTISNGTISGNAYGIYNEAGGTIGTLNNSTGAVLTAYAGTALLNSGSIGSLTNDGVIIGSADGVRNQGTITSFSNTMNGLVAAQNSGSAIENNAQIGSLSNDGLVTAVYGAGVYNSYFGTIGSINNSATGSIVSSATGPLNNTAIYNAGQIGSLTNNGLIASDGWGGAGINNQGGSIGTLSNGGSIGGGQYGVVNAGGEGGPGTITELANSGVIHGGNTGIYNAGTIGSLSNTSAGTVTASIFADSYGIINQGQIGSLTNSGEIGGYFNGIDNQSSGTLSGSIGTLINANTGTISAGYTGIYNAGQIVSLTNDGLIGGQYFKGIDNWGSGSIGSVINTGQILGGSTGIQNVGVISSLNNSGSIIGESTLGSYGIVNTPTGGEGGPAVISVLTNSGEIGGFYTGIYNSGQIGSLTNSGTILGLQRNGLWNDAGGTIGALMNSGLIGGGNTGINNVGLITSLNNSGSIVGGSTDGIRNSGTIVTLTNTGLIQGNYWGAGIENSGSIGALSNLNTGTGKGTISSSNTGIYNTGTITSLTNSGVISGGLTGIDTENSIGSLSNTGLITGGTNATITGDTYGIYNGNGGTIVSATIGSLYNNGTITGGTAAMGTFTSYGIYNDSGSGIGTLTNDSLGTISGDDAVVNLGTINSLSNAGLISGRTTGIDNYGLISSLVNSGKITGATSGIWNLGLITSLANKGLISGEYSGVANDYAGSIGSFTNSGTILGTGATGDGVYNSGTIGVLTNTGHITGGDAGVSNQHGVIDLLTNSGTLQGTGTLGDGLYNSGSIVSVTNSGLMTGVRAGLYNDVNVPAPTVLAAAQPQLEARPAVIVALINTSTGTITGTATGLYNASLIGGIINAGVISGGGVGLSNEASGSIVALVNSGTVTGTNFGLVNGGSIESLANTGTIKDDSKAGIQNSGSIGTLTSSGLISGAAGLSNTGGSIGSLDNSGTITGTQSDAVYTSGAIGPMSNEGVISGAVHAVNVDSSGAVASLTNSGLISAPTAINVAETGTLGLVTDTGTIAGNILNASTNPLSIAGGGGAVFGTLSGYTGGVSANGIGQITSTAANVAFTAGNLLLNDHINVGSGTVTNAAMLQVNNPLNITGNYQQSAAGTLSVGVAGVSNHGELTVSSAATVSPSGHVALTQLDNFRFAAGESFTLIDATSAAYNVAGMTASAAGFHGGYLVSDVQSGGRSDLVVCLTNLVTANCNGGTPAYSVATTHNAIMANNAVGGYMGSNAALTRLADAVVALGTSPAANRAGNQLLADPHNNGAGLAMQPSLDVLNVVTGHAETARLASNGGESGVSAGESGQGLATWGEAFGGGSHQSQDGQFSGYSMSSEGLVAGGDAAIADSIVRVGAVFTYTHADLHDHGDRTGDTLSLNSDGALLYATFLGDRAYADLLGGVMFDTFDTVRVVDITNFNGVSTGSHDGTQSVAKVSGGYRLPIMGEASATTLTPVWGVIYSHLHQDAYTETGGNGSALRVNGEGDNSLKGEAGLKLEKNFAVSRGDVVPELRLMYRHEFDNGAQLQTASFAEDASATTFSTVNARPIENSGLFSAGVNLLGRDGVTVTLKYTAEVATGYVSQGGSLRVRWAF